MQGGPSIRWSAKNSPVNRGGKSALSFSSETAESSNLRGAGWTRRAEEYLANRKKRQRVISQTEQAEGESKNVYQKRDLVGEGG